MTFGEKLQSLRKSSSTSQEGLAEKLGVSRQAISKWESDQFYPDMNNLIALSELFGVTIDSLLKEKELDPPKAEPQIHLHLTARVEYEFISKTTFLGVPLVHVNIGRGKRVARGIIAVGNLAKGVISVGMVSMGLVSFGLLSVGVVSISVLALGLIAAGCVSIGVCSGGAVAIGVTSAGAIAIGQYAVGASAIASDIAVGDYARGAVAIGKHVHGAKVLIDAGSGSEFPTGYLSAEQVRRFIQSARPGLWQPVVDFLTALF